MSGLHHGTIEVVSSSLLPDTVKLCGPYVDVLVLGTARSPQAEEFR